MPSYRDYRPSLRFQPTLALSPDGRHVAYSDDSTGQFNVTVQPLDGGPARTLTAHRDQTVRRVTWHPGGAWLAYLADDNGSEHSQIYRIDLSGGAPQPLTARPGVQHLLAHGNPFSPDGGLLAYTANDRCRSDQDVLVLDLATGESSRIYAGGGNMHAGHWSPDGRRISVAEWREGNSDHVVYVVTVDGGLVTRLTDASSEAVYWFGPWLPDGRGLIVSSNLDRAFTGLAVLDTDTGALRWLDTPEWNVEEDNVTLSADGRRLAWTVNVDGSSQPRLRDIETGCDIDLPPLPRGQVDVAQLTADGARLAMLCSTATQPWNVVVTDLISGDTNNGGTNIGDTNNGGTNSGDDNGGGGNVGVRRIRRLTRATPSEVDPASLVEPELIRYPRQDGGSVPAYLYRPRCKVDADGPVDPDRSCPVVISAHGGPVWQERPTYLHDGFYQYLVSQGIAVLAPNVRGSCGYGTEYQQPIYRDWGGADLDDFTDAARYLRGQRWVAPERIGLFGRSYGGFMVLSLLSRRPDLNWAAGVDVCGPSNLTTLIRNAPPTWHSLALAMFGDLEENEEFLLSRSPVTHADKIQAPLLVIQGANDPRVPQSESDQVVARLRARGVDVRYDVYPGEGHAFTRSENRAKSHEDAAEFLIAHLSSSNVTS